MSTNQPLLIVLLGPTASGKTALALEIAEKLRIDIHNCDSRQLYKGMDIGTAKPTKEQQKRVPHLLLDIREANHPITLYEFQKAAMSILEQSLAAKGIALLVGGSGLYIKAITQGLIPPAVPPQTLLRQQLNSLGQEICYQLLEAGDPNSAKKINKSDFVRTQRALEVLYATGQPMSIQRNSHPPSWQIIELGLDRKDLYKRILERTISIYKKGLIEETQQLIKRFGPDLPMLQTIGYKEAFETINGKLNINEAIEITTRRTKQFAKRQRTWFKRQHNPYWLKDEEALREAMSMIQAGLV